MHATNKTYNFRILAMTYTENVLSFNYQYAWVSDLCNIHWKELEIFNRIEWIQTAYGKMVFLLFKGMRKR